MKKPGRADARPGNGPAQRPDKRSSATLEGGTKKNPSVAVVKRLAKALGVPVGELLE